MINNYHQVDARQTYVIIKETKNFYWEVKCKIKSELNLS